jgi:hypothetical protein
MRRSGTRATLGSAGESHHATRHEPLAPLTASAPVARALQSEARQRGRGKRASQRALGHRVVEGR